MPQISGTNLLSSTSSKCSSSSHFQLQLQLQLQLTLHSPLSTLYSLLSALLLVHFFFGTQLIQFNSDLFLFAICLHECRLEKST